MLESEPDGWYLSEVVAAASSGGGAEMDGRGIEA